MKNKSKYSEPDRIIQGGGSPISKRESTPTATRLTRSNTSNMFRQAPITAAIIIASELERHSKIGGIELGARRVAEVLLGCVVGVAVSWAMSKLWPLPDPKPQSKSA